MYSPLNWMIPRKTFRAHLKTLNSFVDPYIDHALSLSPDELEKRSNSTEGYTFLHAIASYTRDRSVLRDQLINILLAGRDTTACTLSWLFYELSRNENIVRLLREEIGSTVGWERRPTYVDLKGMKHLQYSLNETLRLYPVGESDFRFRAQHARVAPLSSLDPLIIIFLSRRVTDPADSISSAIQRAPSPPRHNASPRRRPRREQPDRHYERHSRWILNSLYAAPAGHLSADLSNICPAGGV